MHRLVRIEGLNDLKVGNTLKFVLYDGSKYITLNGNIDSRNYIVFKDHADNVITLFTGFGLTSIPRITTYCRKQDPHCLAGAFPEHSSLEALKKTLLSFFDLNTDIKIPPMYKVGDKVRIKSEYDLGSNGADYPCGFTDIMLEMGIDKETFTISAIKPYNAGAKYAYCIKHYKEPYYYELKEDPRNWSAAMFEGEITKSESSMKKSTRISSIEGVMVYLTNGEKIKLTSTTYYYSGVTNILNNLGIISKDSAYGSIFHSQITCSRRGCCFEPEVKDHSLLWVILDYLKYYFGTEECKKTINPEFYKYLKEKHQQGIIEQIKYSQTKIQENAYQFCKAKGTVCRGNVPEGRIVSGKHSKATVSSRPLAYGTAAGW